VSLFSLPVRRSPGLFKSARNPFGFGKFSFLHFTTRAILYALERFQGAIPMEWTTPQHEEIDLNCEISSYANAEL
jgi:hypothetical protein